MDGFFAVPRRQLSSLCSAARFWVMTATAPGELRQVFNYCFIELFGIISCQCAMKHHVRILIYTRLIMGGGASTGALVACLCLLVLC